MESMESFEARVLERTGFPLSALPTGTAEDVFGGIVCRRDSLYVVWVGGDPDDWAPSREPQPADWRVVMLGDASAEPSMAVEAVEEDSWDDCGCCCCTGSCSMED